MSADIPVERHLSNLIGTLRTIPSEALERIAVLVHRAWEHVQSWDRDTKDEDNHWLSSMIFCPDHIPGSFDYAIPQSFYDLLYRLTDENPSGHFVWWYPPNVSTPGYPMPVTARGLQWLPVALACIERLEREAEAAQPKDADELAEHNLETLKNALDQIMAECRVTMKYIGGDD